MIGCEYSCSPTVHPVTGIFAVRTYERCQKPAKSTEKGYEASASHPFLRTVRCGLVPEQRFAEKVFDSGFVVFRIVELFGVDPLDALQWGVSRNGGVDAILDGDHQPAVPLEELIDGHVPV